METSHRRSARRVGRDYVPYAADSCQAVARREARDGHAFELYARISKLGDGSMTPAQVLDAVTNSPQHNLPQVPVGGQKAIPTTLALSFDASLTRALVGSVTPNSPVSRKATSMERTNSPCL